MFDKTDPDVMMAIGGMEGVLEEASLFNEFARQGAHRRKKMIYVLCTTGGAAEKLADRAHELREGAAIHLLEDEWAGAVKVSLRSEKAGGDPHQGRRFTPYLVMMQWPVERISRE